VISARLAADHADFLWDVSYIDDGVAIWQALLRNQVSFKAAIGPAPRSACKSSAGAWDRIGWRLRGGQARRRDQPAALSRRRSLLAKARAELARTGQTLDIPGGGWIRWRLDSCQRRAAEGVRAAHGGRDPNCALSLDVPTGDSIMAEESGWR